MKSIDTLGSDFARRHEWLLVMAKMNEVALCGGCAAAISKDRQDYAPADIDLVTTKANALRFVDAINHFLLDRQVHYRIYANCHNDFVPAPAVGHFRIQCPFWLPVCLFIIPHDQFRYYRIQGGHLLQLPKDVKQAANALTEHDGKPRLANEESDELEDLQNEAALEQYDEPLSDELFWFEDRLPIESEPPFDPVPYTKPL